MTVIKHDPYKTYGSQDKSNIALTWKSYRTSQHRTKNMKTCKHVSAWTTRTPLRQVKKRRVNSCTPEWWAVPVPHLVPVVLLLLQTRWYQSQHNTNNQIKMLHCGYVFWLPQVKYKRKYDVTNFENILVTHFLLWF
jgi:hypothetical protein